MQRRTLRLKFVTARLTAFSHISLAASLISLFKAGMLFGFWRWITLHPRTSRPMGWGQGCELFLLQIQLQNTRRCCLWSSLNSLHLWNLNGLTFCSFRIILQLVLEKSNFLAIWRIEDVGFSCIYWLISCFAWGVALKIWLSG